jgi:cell division protein FtsA
MFDRQNQIIVGLEIGTHKVCAVGEVNEYGALNIIGLGQARSRGVRKGEITDLPTAEEDVRSALAEAENMSGVEISSVYLGITGNHVHGIGNRGVHPVVAADRIISAEDVHAVVRNAKAINIPPQNQILHAARQHFTVDDQTGVENPVGMSGARLAVDMHVIHGLAGRIENPLRAVKGLQIQVEAVVFNGLASALAMLTSEQKEMGAITIDIGGGTTEYAVYCRGIVRHTGVIGVGGDHISNDLFYGLCVPLSLAEQLKLQHGSALVDQSVRGQTITLPQGAGLQHRAVNLENLRLIIHHRVDEILELIADDIIQRGLAHHVRAGVFLSGGTSRLPGIRELAEQVFGLPTSLGRTAGINGLSAALDQPEFVTPIGLVKYGSFQEKPRVRSRFQWPFGLGELLGGRFSF